MFARENALIASLMASAASIALGVACVGTPPRVGSDGDASTGATSSGGSSGGSSGSTSSSSGGSSGAPDDASSGVTDAGPAGLVARWPFDDGAGTTTSEIVNGRTGTVHGDASWVPGEIGGAIHFDGDGDYVEVPWHPSLDVGQSFTIALWIRTEPADASTVDPRVYSQGDSWNVKLNGLKKPQLTIASQKYAAADYDMPVGQWHHLTLTFDAGLVNFYVDGFGVGIETSTLVAGDTVPADSDPIYIGSSTTPGAFVRAAVDDVRLYDRALSKSEIAQIAKP